MNMILFTTKDSFNDLYQINNNGKIVHMHTNED
jgi:hypothetical protein